MVARFLFFCIVSCAATAARAEGLQFQIRDSDGAPMPCRIHLADEAGRPQQSGDLPFWHDHFVCDGNAELDLPPGTYHWTIERGPEYESLSGQHQLIEGTPHTSETVLKRLANLNGEGWYSGDLHVHRPVEHVPLLLRAEDLNFAPVIQWWNAKARPSAPVEQIQQRVEANRYLWKMGGEDEREGGALLYFGLDRPLDLDARNREFPSPMVYVGQARAASREVWIDIEKPFWWDVPAWLASGQMQSIGLANNHMMRSVMLPNEAWGKPRDARRLPSPLGNGYWSQEIYYHILNTGIRIPPSAGSASGVLRNPVGYNRVYVHLDEQEFTPKAWFSGLKAGRCFVTNGPLLRVSANGRRPGLQSNIKLPESGALDVELEIQLTSRDYVPELEVVFNGEILSRIACQDQLEQELKTTISIDRPGWFLVRAITENRETFRFASTAPWYVESETQRTVRHLESVKFFLQWQQQRTRRLTSNLKDQHENMLRLALEPHRRSQAFWLRKLQQAKAQQAVATKPVAASSAACLQLPRSRPVDSQPLLSASRRLLQAMQHLGRPLPTSMQTELDELSTWNDDAKITRRIEELLDPYCLAAVSVRKNASPTVTRGPANPELLEQGWRTFLVKVLNEPSATGRLRIESPNAQPLPHAPADQVESRWMQISTFDGRPMRPNLSGLGLEYRIVQIYSRDTGNKQAVLEFHVGGSGAGTEIIKQWRFDRDQDGWHAMNQAVLSTEDGSLQFESLGDDPFIGAEVEARGGSKVLKFWAQTDIEGIGQLFWWTEDRPQPTGDRQTNFVLQPGKEHLYEVPFHADGPLRGVRLDPLVKPGKMRIDWIDLHHGERETGWSKLPMQFTAAPATELKLRVFDAQGLPAVARFEIRDQEGRIYPAQSKRLAPDFFFQRQIYREDGESVPLPPGTYQITCSRGPESLPQTQQVVIDPDNNPSPELRYRVARWIDPASRGWWSGDHHIHAAGCLHYQNPTEGVAPSDMIRHTMGEDLKVGCCLTWGPCFDFQKRFFSGATNEESREPYILRYDVEVSGFGSHSSGHLNLLNLQEQIYPGGESKDHWPTLGLNTLRWAKRQGAVCGPAHSSIGLTQTLGRVPNIQSKDGPHGLPNYELPAYDGIGANEFIVDVTHQVPGPDGKSVPAVDFISTMNTVRVAEWNMWYQVLNCGLRVAASGETDFPCMSGERVGIGRVYAQVDGPLTFEKWVQSIADGRSYVSDGSCHLMDFQATQTDRPTTKLGIAASELHMEGEGTVKFQVAAGCRREDLDEVEVELIVNGYPRSTVTMPADGMTRDLTLEARIDESCWVALRCFPYAHTNPIYIQVDKQPMQPVADSVRWCLAGVEQCWKSKRGTYADAEQADAESAYQHAREFYQSLLHD